MIVQNGNDHFKLTSGTPGGAGMEVIAKTFGYCDARRFGVSHSKMNLIFYSIIMVSLYAKLL